MSNNNTQTSSTILEWASTPDPREVLFRNALNKAHTPRLIGFAAAAVGLFGLSKAIKYAENRKAELKNNDQTKSNVPLRQR